MRFYDDLTAEQRAAVDAALQPGENSITVEPGETAVSLLAASNLTGAVFDTPERRYARILKDAELKIAVRLGRGLSSSWDVSLKDDPDGTTLADARHWPGIGCVFRTYPALAGKADSDVRTTLAHEMFHCFQYDLIGGTSKFNYRPDWIMEGQAEWVGEAIAGPSATVGLGWWDEYLSTPHMPLWGRSYDATGFYWHLAETGVDPWQHFDSMLLNVGSNADAYRAAGAEGDEFAYSWASSMIRQPAMGSAWDTKAVWETLFRAPVTPRSVAASESVPVVAPPVTNDVYSVTAPAEVVELRVNGHVRLHLPGGDVLGLEQLWLCTKFGGCECPPGESYSGPDLVTAPNPFFLALTGGLRGAEGQLRGHSLSEFCEHEETPKPDDGDDDCSDCAMSNGDPHIVTVDGSAYDFMAAGEFVALRNADASFELQVRQEPYGDSHTVSINTALAVRAGSSRIAIYATDSETLEVRVDGTLADPRGSPLTVSGVAVRHIDAALPSLELSFLDGTRIIAIGELQYGINLTVDPSDVLREQAVGVMGPVPPEGLGVPALPDGSILPEAFGHAEYNAQLYGPFEDAWRVTTATSLFDYGAGASTATYTLPDFPVEQELQTMDDFSADQIARATAACAGLDNETLTLQCIFDVIVTGDLGFTRVYEQTATIVDTGALPATDARARVVNLYSEDGQPVQLDVYAWTYSETEMSEVAALVATVPYGQASDWFNPGLVETPFGDQPYTKLTVERHGEAADPISPLAATSEFLGPGTVTTIAIWQERLFDAPSAHLQTIYAAHPSYPVPEAPDGQGLIVSRNSGLRAEDEPPMLFASVGDGCLESPVGRTFPDIPNAQPISNDLVVPAGDHTLTLHEQPAGELPTCTSPAVGPGAPISVAAGDRLLVFPYRLPGASEIQLLVVAFGD